ncbi:MAG: hypothetical protein K9L02_07120 [Acholeplasmataceae bacterium]|nr:hypothetical protein [Acholeplasmataceae bacterium]
MQMIIYGFLWIIFIHIILNKSLRLTLKKSMLIVQLISLTLITYKSFEYGFFWIQGDFTKMPVEYSAITYILFSITFIFNIKFLKPFVTFAAFLSGIGYLVTFPFLGGAFIEGNGLTTTLLALFNHSLLYLGSMIAMKHKFYSIESRKSILICTLLVVAYSITMQYLINFDGKYLFIYMVLDGRILYQLFNQMDIDGFIFLPYNLLIISIYLGMISIFYKVNIKVYEFYHKIVPELRTREVIKHEHTV